MTNQEFTPLNPIAVANFIIDTLSNVAQDSPLTNLKLQKMLYCDAVICTSLHLI